MSIPDNMWPLQKPAKSTATAGGVDIANLQVEYDRLLLTTAALWEILKEKNGLEDKELLQKIVEIDLRDGSLDGRVPATPPEPCPHCQRPVNKHSVKCMFCGEPLMMNPFAR